MKKIAIVGAGLAGLTAARQVRSLAPTLGEVTLFEKSRGFGGRMATRRQTPFAFDHGAQYFTARSEGFRRLVETRRTAGVVGLWPQALHQWADGTMLGGEPVTESRYVGTPAMPALAVDLAQGLDVRLETEVQALIVKPTAASGPRSGQWDLFDAQGHHLGLFDHVIAAIPAPQAARLLPTVFRGHDDLAQVRMSGCFTLMIGSEDVQRLGISAARIDHPLLAWISVNSSKPGRETPGSLVVHARNDWSEAHLEDDRAEIRQRMLAALREVIGRDLSGAAAIDLHRWRYANVEAALGKPYLYDTEHGLGACGDWCLGNRVEAAFTSGEAMGAALAADLMDATGGRG